MVKMVNSKFGWTWPQFVKADADCDRYWQAKKAEKRSLIEATKKSPRVAAQGEKKTSEKIYIDFQLASSQMLLSRKMEAIMMKNVSNSTKAPDLGMASFNLSTAKGLIEALSDEFDIMEGSVTSYRNDRTEKNAAILAYGTNRSFYTWMALLRTIQEYVDSSLATIDEADK